MKLLCKIVGHRWLIGEGWIASGRVKVRCSRCAQSAFVLDVWTGQPMDVGRRNRGRT